MQFSWWFIAREKHFIQKYASDKKKLVEDDVDDDDTKQNKSLAANGAKM